MYSAESRGDLKWMVVVGVFFRGGGVLNICKAGGRYFLRWSTTVIKMIGHKKHGVDSNNEACSQLVPTSVLSDLITSG